MKYTFSIMRRVLLCLPGLILAFALLPQHALGERQPLLQDGKKTLFQRVISHPGARLYEGPAADAPVAKNHVTTFTAFYVFSKVDNRLEVGVSTHQPDGWIDAARATEWPQAITMLFTDRTGRMPVLFFRDHDSLVTLSQDDSFLERLAEYRSRAEKNLAEGTGDPTLPVVAMEPPDEEGAVSRNRFYLMPVMDMDNQFQATRLIEVSTIDPGDGVAGTTEAGLPPSELNTAIAFVIDTTISMRPYIERTLKLIRTIYDELEKSPHGDKVAFAVVAYRNSTQASPDLGYVTRVISDFKTVRDRQSLEEALAAVHEATASSHSFAEDSLAGVKSAADLLTWSGYGSRVMLLVGDAGPLPEDDPYASVSMSPNEMADYLRANNIWLTALHIKSPIGKEDHAPAEKAYRELSRMPDGTAAYIPLDATDGQRGVLAFERSGKALADSYNRLVAATAEGTLLARPSETELSDDPVERARQLGSISGYAMQLEFLGASRQNRVPHVVRAWIADADLEQLAANPDRPVPVVEPAVLLTKNQLSDLTAQLKMLIEQSARSQRLGGTDFFESLVSMAAQITRDPSRFSHSPGQNLAQTGVLAEFLEGLPYRSDVLGMTENDWYNKSIGEQAQFINRLKSRIARYEEYDRDRTNWESFGSSNSGDWVYRVPLSMLP